ncbi:helix-turn-helix domain-containing protein [Fluviicola sp.]|uniref:helix-turn-helix domain-containing protein n=1 Tax=Fluviicola sp. TaxID=1917219 RepID=UPI0031D6921F
MKAKKSKTVVLLTCKQAVDFLQITSPTLRKWTKEGLLKAYSLGGRIYYKQHEIIDALQAID